MSGRGILGAVLLGGGALWLTRAAAAAPAAYVSYEASSRTWRIGNDLLERAMRLDEGGRFLTTSFLDKRRGRNWSSADLASGEFRIALLPAGGAEPGEEIERTGRNTWTLVSDSRDVGPDGTADLAIGLGDPLTGAGVELHYRVFPGLPVVRSWLEVRNDGSTPLTVTAADAFSITVKGDGSVPGLFWVHNFSWSDPAEGFATNGESLPAGTTLSFLTGPFGDAAAWFALRAAGSGDGLFGGWEWSGTGLFAFTADPSGGGAVSLRAGLAPGGFAHTLRKGDTFTAPAGFVGFFRGGWEGASLATRRLVESRYAPPLPDERFPWIGFDTWGYSLSVNEALVGDLIDRAAALGLETFTLDAGWMERIGDWRPRSGAFDGGIRALSDRAHARGLKFGLWMAFGVADPQSDVVREHPDWVATDDGEPIPGDFGTVQLCLADPEVQAWVISEIDRVVEDYGVDWLLHDFGVIAACASPAHGHQSGDGEWATTAGYYAILDEVRRRHPKLVIENCWNGGSMFDFGMLPRHDTSNTSDVNSALSGRQAVYGATYVLPPRYAGKYIAEDGTPPGYRFASGLPGGSLLFMGRPTEWDGATASAARSAAARFKELRKVLRDGTLYHLTPPPAWDGWDGLLSWDAGSGEGVLLVYRGGLSVTFEGTLFPRGLPGSTTFELACEESPGTGTLAGGVRSAEGLGSHLSRGGIPVEILSPGDVAVIRIRSDDPPGDSAGRSR